ncbi:MAG: metallophosphoesterase [Oscillospiraceae bacterium]|nr:metallophosphoesterase [Oscillospiraceae bacterium]
MARIFLIADTHLGDDIIIKLENRPFKNSKEQTDSIVEKWNSVVNEDDIVYVVGDFLHIGCDSYHMEQAKKLNGKKYLVRGNHDTESDEFYIDECGFAKVYDHPIIVDDFWIFSHEPMYINKYFPYANIFGHVHDNPSYATFSSRHYCICVERTGYTPITFDAVKATVMEEDRKVRIAVKNM